MRKENYLCYIVCNHMIHNTMIHNTMKKQWFGLLNKVTLGFIF